MRKTIAILLTLALMAGLFVIPAAAAENAFMCSGCGGPNFTDTTTGTSQSSRTVSSCDYYTGSHTHVLTYWNEYMICDDCGAKTVISRSLMQTFCGASNMYLRVGVVTEVM